MPEVITLVCDSCALEGAGRIYNDRGVQVAILCDTCESIVKLENDGRPYFRSTDSKSWTWEGPHYTGAYNHWREKEALAMWIDPETVMFLGEEMTPAQALSFLDDFDKTSMYMGKHRRLNIGLFTVEVTANLGADAFGQEGAPFYVVEQAVEEWLKPALGIG